jgi:hypothetical protein
VLASAAACGVRSVDVNVPRRRRFRRSGRCPERGVGDRLPVRLHHRRQGDQDRLDDPRTHPKVAASSRRAFDHRPEARHRARSGVRGCWRPTDGAADGYGPELVSLALQQFCAGKVGLSYFPPGTPWNNGYIESFNNRLRNECLNRNHWTTLLEAGVAIGDFKGEHNHRHRHTALGYLTPAESAAACRHTTMRWTARTTESERQQPGSRTGSTQYRGLATMIGSSMECLTRTLRESWLFAAAYLAGVK